MLMSIAKVLVSAVAAATVAVFKAEIEQGVAVVRGGFDHALHGRGLEPPSADLQRAEVGGGAGQWALAGLVLAGVGVLLLPQVQRAVLDFHDGALRKLGARAQRTFDGWQARREDAAFRVVEAPEGDVEPNEHEFEPQMNAVPVH